MLKDMALKYYRRGENCSQCVLRACNEKYGLSFSEDCFSMCGGIWGGFGVGSICSVLVACIMIIARMCPQDTARKRIQMIDRFNSELGGINCGKIRKGDCEKIIRASCDILEEIIEE